MKLLKCCRLFNKEHVRPISVLTFLAWFFLFAIAYLVQMIYFCILMVSILLVSILLYGFYSMVSILWFLFYGFYSMVFILLYGFYSMVSILWFLSYCMVYILWFIFYGLYLTVWFLSISWRLNLHYMVFPLYPFSLFLFFSASLCLLGLLAQVDYLTTLHFHNTNYSTI